MMMMIIIIISPTQAYVGIASDNMTHCYLSESHEVPGNISSSCMYKYWLNLAHCNNFLALMAF